MNLKHAVQTIAKRGLTERQARFLVLVARHSGVCVMRQYSTFAGIVFGQKTRKFFNKLVHLGLVSTYDCAHNRGRVYHLRHRAIYEATVRGERASPIREAILTELRWYFERVACPPTEASPPADRARFERCRQAFDSDRHALLYRRWKHDGERVLATASSPILAEAIESGAGKIEPLVLPHAYSHLALLVGVA